MIAVGRDRIAVFFEGLEHSEAVVGAGEISQSIPDAGIGVVFQDHVFTRFQVMLGLP